MKIIVGANNGDEGKGLMTDFLVVKDQSDLVVRFNGGAQAGHTVITPDGRRHVFSHFGSGCFAGADTLLSHFFIVNPMVFRRERQELESKRNSLGTASHALNLKVTIDWDAPVTTPFDMLINQMVEVKRGGARHGSCGLGIGETIERGEQFISINARDLTNPNLKQILYRIRDTWVPIRRAQLGLGSDFDHIFMSEALIENYLNDIEYLLNNTQLGYERATIISSHNPIFEGAQGLLLDQDHENFPHVTRSSTGIKNVLSLVSGLTSELDVVYATRAYMTRHGAGPLFQELREKPFEGIVDETNISNTWQGSLRFGYLNLDLLQKTIRNDLLTNKLDIKVNTKLAITCLDQCDPDVPVYHEGRICNLSNGVGDLIAEKVGIENYYKSFGPTRETVI